MAWEVWGCTLTLIAPQQYEVRTKRTPFCWVKTHVFTNPINEADPFHILFPTLVLDAAASTLEMSPPDGDCRPVVLGLGLADAALAPQRLRRPCRSVHLLLHALSVITDFSYPFVFVLAGTRALFFGISCRVAHLNIIRTSCENFLYAK